MKNALSILGAILIIIIAAVASFVIMNQPPDSTNLSDVLIDGLSIGSPATSANPQKYGSSKSQLTESCTFEIASPDGTKDLLFISLANDKISFISMAFGHENIPITVNGHAVSSIEEVSRLLNRAYREEEYDHEHGIMMHSYRDYEHRIRADFLYEKETHQLTKLILDQLPE